MTLLERYRANECAVVDCNRERIPDGPCCRDDMRELWANRLIRQVDGSYLRRRAFPIRDLTWSRAA